MRERRQFTRITLNIQNTLSLYQIEAYHTGTIANISMGGCLFSVGEELPVGEDCQVIITVGEGLETEKISIAGQVVRSDVEGVGIKFIDISQENQRQLEKIIANSTAAKK